MARVVAWVDRRLAEQPPPARRWGGTATTIAGAAGVVALTDPEIRKAAQKGLTRAREQALKLWQQWTSGTQPPGQP
jgi:hypothetical protein